MPIARSCGANALQSRWRKPRWDCFVSYIGFGDAATFRQGGANQLIFAACVVGSRWGKAGITRSSSFRFAGKDPLRVRAVLRLWRAYRGRGERSDNQRV
jgi:hypothetical protein